MLQQPICIETQVKLQEKEIHRLYRGEQTMRGIEDIRSDNHVKRTEKKVTDKEHEKNHLYAKLLSIISDEDRLKYEKILADLLTKKDQPQVDQCVNCEREAEEFDEFGDEGLCQDCVIDIGISMQEAKNDRD